MATKDKHSEVLGSGAGLAGSIAIESGPELGESVTAVKARGYWEQIWIRLKRDRVAIGSGVFIVLLVLICFPGAWLAEHLLGHGPNDQFFDAVDDRLIPVGPMSHVHDPLTGKEHLFILGADSTVGHDEFLRLLYGGRVSLEVAVLSTTFAVTIGVLMGATAGYFRGTVDTVISRIIEVTMAFPALLFIIALASTVGGRLDSITFGGVFAPGVFTLVLVFTAFGWFFPARIIRAQVLSLREKEFVEAASMWARRLEDHPFAPAAAPGRADHRLLDRDRGRLRARGGGAFVPEPGHQAAAGELGQPAGLGAGVLHLATVADALARAGRAADDACVQPARRRPPRRVRPPLLRLSFVRETAGSRPRRARGRGVDRGLVQAPVADHEAAVAGGPYRNADSGGTAIRSRRRLVRDRGVVDAGAAVAARRGRRPRCPRPAAPEARAASAASRRSRRAR